MLSYLRWFVPGFAAITVPLARLMKGGEQELIKTWKYYKIVEIVLAKLAEHSRLRLSNLKQPFVLECELGECGLGGVLL